MENKKSPFCASEGEQKDRLEEMVDDINDDIPKELYDVGGSTKGCPKYGECIKMSFILGRTRGVTVGWILGMLCMLLISMTAKGVIAVISEVF